MKELQDLLQPLVTLLSQSGLKSKQAAFNRHFDDLARAKEIASWEAISNYINVQTDDHLTAKSINAIFHRAKAKNEKQLGRFMPVSPRPTSSLRSRRERESQKGSVDFESNVSDTLLKQYMQVCFNNERIALRAIEGGVSIDIIESWKSPNSVRLGNALTNYISKK